jgi:DNA-directed RNA polymerase specialized sigma24 family protein
MPSTTTLFDLLEREWPQLERSASASIALRRWGSEEPALAFERLGDLVAFAGGADARRGDGASDPMLAALARRAPSDDLAARVLLQVLLPGLKALAARYQWMGGPEEASAAAVVAAYERIRTYPIDRRPARIAANVLADTRQQLWRRGRRMDRDCLAPTVAALRPSNPEPQEPGAGVEVLDLLVDPGASVEAHVDEELPELLTWALAEGHLSAEAAELIVQTRAHGVSIAEVCRRTGRSAQTIRRQRLRAEDRLRAAVAATAA